MARIFLSYRRSDVEPVAARIHDHLALSFGFDEVFRDVHGISVGDDAGGRISDELNNCSIFLILIGDRWLNATSAIGTNIFDMHDYINVEVSEALKRQIPIIPILVGPAVMPTSAQLPASLQKLSGIQAIKIRTDAGFHSDMSDLIDKISSKIDIQFLNHLDLIEDCRGVGLVTVKSSFDRDQTILSEISRSQELIVVMNDGRSWVDTKRELLASRASDPSMKTKILLLHPRSSFLKTLIKKNGKSLRRQREEIQASRDVINSYKWSDGCLDLRAHHIFNPYTLIIGDEFAFVSTYFLNESGQLPLFKYERRSPGSLYHSLRSDAVKLFDAAEPLRDDKMLSRFFSSILERFA